MLKLYNTLTRSVGEFTPAEPPSVGLYSCGPTVYDFAHIGNLRTYLFADILKRTLTYNGYRVKHVMNITDVGHLASDADTGEDKMEKGSRREGKTVWDIAVFYTNAFKRDLALLNIKEPDIWCKATDHIAQQIRQIEQIDKNGFAYRTSSGIYFDTGKLADYGKLARLDLKGLDAGARIELDGEKRNPTDFALWKYSYPSGRPFDPKQDDPAARRQMEWSSPWGLGFPGWHIECSAMATHYLGQPFDIHTGGEDHIPVHHTNEIAQAEAASGSPLAHWWLHGAFLVVPEGKMAKSKNNFLTLQTLIDRGFDPCAYRYFTFSAHYRKPLTFTWEALRAAQIAFHKLRMISLASRESEDAAHKDILPNESAPQSSNTWRERFYGAVNDDLNMPQALAVIWELARSSLLSNEKNILFSEFDQILGLGLSQPHPHGITPEIPDEIKKLAEERNRARQEKNFEYADMLRLQIEQHGYSIRDMQDGYEITSSKINKTPL